MERDVAALLSFVKRVLSFKIKQARFDILPERTFRRQEPDKGTDGVSETMGETNKANQRT
jgi:hypothetical protein